MEHVLIKPPIQAVTMPHTLSMPGCLTQVKQTGKSGDGYGAEGTEFAKWLSPVEANQIADMASGFNPETMQEFWYWIATRMYIRHQRVIKRVPGPWVDDPVFNSTGFTNCIRDIDRGTIRYYNLILKHVDDFPGPDETVADVIKDVMLNTIIYRIFIREETVKSIGFIHLRRWDTEWPAVCERLYAIRESKQPVFHGAYMMCNYDSTAPAGTDGRNKLANILNCIENFYKPKIDEMYEVANNTSMPGLLKWLADNMPYMGSFNAYEVICDWCMCSRHTSKRILAYTDDSYVNVGPGCYKGLKLIFPDVSFKDMPPYKFVMYLRAYWKHFMSAYTAMPGKSYLALYLDSLPCWMSEHPMNLRVIEHSLCEYQKYFRVKHGGHAKKGFKHMNDTSGRLDELLLHEQVEVDTDA